MFTRSVFSRGTFWATVMGVVTIMALGGCPVAQQPVTPSDDSQTSTASSNTSNNQRPENRPVPPVDTDEDTGADTGGSSGGSTGGGSSGGDSGGSGGDGGDGSDSGPTPVKVLVFAPNANREVVRGASIDVEYRVDGDATAIELVYQKDADTTVLVKQDKLNVEGKVAFSSEDPGVYRLGIRATGADEGVVTQYAPGKVTVVGDTTISFTNPSTDQVIRPNTPVPVSLTVTTLAGSVTTSVYADPDPATDGGEVLGFTSTQKNVSGNIQTSGFQLGVQYSIYAVSTDSAGQTTPKVFAQGRFKIVPTPTVSVFEPASSATINAGDPVTVVFAATDTEGTSLVAVFVDSDGVLNGDETVVADDIALDVTSVDVDTTGYTPGKYYFGAWVFDPATNTVLNHDYAEGTRTIPGITITSPATDTNIRSPQVATLTWNAVYSPSDFKSHEVIRATDFDNDGQPDGPPVVVAGTGFNPGTNNFTISPVGLKNRYMFGVRLTDKSNVVILQYAPGDVIVANDPPNVILTAPNEPTGVRPGTPQARIAMAFNVIDTENLLKPGDGLQVVAARDDDLDGKPDGDPVFARTDAALRLGQNPNFRFDVTELADAGLIDDPVHDKFGYFLLGIRVTDDAGQSVTKYATNGPIILDAVEPTIALVSPTENVVKDRLGTIDVTLAVADTSPTAVRVRLDRDFNASNTFNGQTLIDWTEFAANEQKVFTIDLTTLESGYFWVYLEVSDGVGTVSHFVPKDATDKDDARIFWIRDRLIGQFYVDDLKSPDNQNGGILQGFNFNDLAGSSIERVPDVDDDGDDEWLIASRFGKPFIINNSIGVGFGEAYMGYGDDGNNRNKDRKRLAGAQSLNAVGRGSIPGLAFPGVRIPLDKTWTEGISDVVVVPDMDGDELPEIVFSFPRVESLNLGAPAFVNQVPYQHPELIADISGMGDLEYDAINYMNGQWIPDVAQFTRGGVVIVSSHNSNFTNEFILNRKSDRLIDLHEIGQMFSSMSRPGLVPYIARITPQNPPSGCKDCGEALDLNDCDVTNDGTDNNDTTWTAWNVYWDEVLDNQPPGGFMMPWSATPVDPPLANPSSNPWTLGLIDLIYPPSNECGPIVGCKFKNNHFAWGNCLAGIPFPCTTTCAIPGWHGQFPNGNAESGISVWTGFYGPDVTIRDFSLGARVLGQKVDDRFGTAVGTDGKWLFISAPRHTATKLDVPLLPDAGGERDNCGVVYQYRIDTRTSANAPTRSQLWMEIGQVDTDGDGTPDSGVVWPLVDAEGAKGQDTTMPVPHQYIIEDIGSVRGGTLGTFDYSYEGTCPPSFAAQGGSTADEASACYQPYAVGTAGYYMDRTPQIVGPHQDARVSFVHGIGDVNDDGLIDFAVGSPDITSETQNWPTPGANDAKVGAIFIVFSRSTGQEGDYLLDRLALDPSNPQRLSGVLLKGASTTEPLARVFDGAGDFNGDGVDDVIIGSASNVGSAGDAVVILGSRELNSPAGGYTLDQVVADGRGIRFVGAAAGDLAGANVAGVGDVDSDGTSDILISAPGAVDPTDPSKHPGVTYLIYGSKEHVPGVINLGLVGTPELPGVVFIGRADGDAMGGGELSLTVNPDNQPTQIYSRGVARLGDIDGDGRADYAISAMLADPNGKTNSGEVYVIYGRGDQPPP